MITYLDFYTTLHRRINTLLSVSVFYSRDEYRKTLSKVICDFFPLLKWLSSVVGGEDIDVLFEKFKSLYNLDPSEKIKDIEYSKKDMNDFSDEINYLKVCVKNTCNLDLDNVDAEEVKNHEFKPKNFCNIQDTKTPKSEFVYHNFLNNFEDSFGTGMEGLVAHAHARAKIETKIRTGEIYIYKTKPFRNILIKWILAIIWTIGFAFSTVAVWKCTNSSDSSDKLSSVLFFMSYFVFHNCVILRGIKNKNYLYSFSKLSFVFIFPFFVLLIILTFSSSLNFTMNDVFWKIIWGGVISSTVFGTILFLVSYLYLQPEANEDLFEELMNKYTSNSSESSSPKN